MTDESLDRFTDALQANDYLPEHTANLRGVLASPRRAETLPEHIGRYRVVERLGAGGQAEVFRAIHPLLGQDVVIKWARLNVPETFRDRLVDEARILVKMDGPGLVRVYDVDLHEGRPFIVMEFVPGRSLESVLQSERLTLERAVALVADLAGALARVHPQGVTHRDLKPANVLIDAAGKPRLLDFGLACLTQAHQEIGSPEKGVIVGTPAYMSPEQAAGQQGVLGPHTDIFGLGAILYHLLTNRPPYQGDSSEAILWQAQLRLLTPLRQLNPRVPPALERICERAMSANPAERPASAAALEKSLRAALRRPRLKGQRWLLGVTAAVALLGSGMLLGAHWFDRPARLNEAPAAALPPLRIRPLRVQHYKTVAGEEELTGQIGQKAPLPHFGDAVTLGVELSAPAYCYVLAFNFDGSEQLLWPVGPKGEPADHLSPPCVERVRFPANGRLYLEEKGATSGLQAYAVAASSQPLPPFALWRKGRSAIRWAALPAGKTVWEADAVGAYPAMIGLGQDRGTVRPVPGMPPLGPLCQALLADGVEVVEAIAFPVLPKEDER